MKVSTESSLRLTSLTQLVAEATRTEFPLTEGTENRRRAMECEGSVGSRNPGISRNGSRGICDDLPPRPLLLSHSVPFSPKTEGLRGGDLA